MVQRGNPHNVLPIQAQRDPAGSQDPHGRSGGQYPGQQLRLIEQLLKVVHHEQEFAVQQRLGEVGLGRLRRRRRQAQGPRHRRGEQRRITNRG